MSAGARLPPGTLFARDYRIVRFLAAGGMGAVYVAEQLSTGKERALKVMHDPLAATEDRRERFVREARASARIDSDHVIETLAAGIDEETDTPWLAMELLKGQDLARRLKERGAFPPDEVLEIFRQLCHGLGAAHREGLVHRDLKPDNVFLAHARRDDVPFTVKILDFGLATLVRGEQSSDLTAGLVVGSPMWMAPEQVDKQHPVSPATDVWALGLLAFRLLTARYYWHNAQRASGSMPAVLSELMLDPIVPASTRAHEHGVGHLLPEGFDEWFARCLQRDPEARFRNASLAMMALQPVLVAAAPRAAASRRAESSASLPAAVFGDDASRSLPLPPQPEAPAGEFAPPPPRLGRAAPRARSRGRRALAPVALGLGALALGALAWSGQRPLRALYTYTHGLVYPVAAPDVNLAEGEAPRRAARVTPLAPDADALAVAQAIALPPQLAPVQLARGDAALARRLERAHICLRRFQYACAQSALAGHGEAEEELALLVTVARGLRREADAQRTMRRYLERYPAGPHASAYRAQLAGQPAR